MADYVNNYKYVAEAWIENGEEEGFKTSFLNSLFLQWQGHSDDEQNPKFNADMVDGHHYSDIEELVNEAVSNTIKDFYIGYTHFGGHEANEHYIIGSEAVRLYPNVSTMTEVPSGFSSYQEYLDSFVFPWNSNEDYEIGSLEEISNPNLYQVIKELYYQLQNDLDEKADYGEFQTFKEAQEEFNSQFDNFHFTEDGIDASSVNGLRFFIVTQEQYENISEESKRNIHNIYIIKEQEDITAYYESINQPGKTEYDSNPDIAPWDRAYTFKVDYTTYNGQDNVLCLMYKLTSEDDTQWKVISPASNFIDATYLEELVTANLSDASRPLDKNSLIASILTLSPTSDKTSILKFPITRVFDDRYISGARYPNYTGNESNPQKIDVPIVTKTENITDASGTTVATLKLLDLTNPLSNLKTVLDNKINSIKNIIGTSNDNSNQPTLYGKIKQNSENILSTTNSLNALKGNSQKSIKDLEDEIAQLKLDVAEEVRYGLNTDLGTWKRYYLGGYIYPKGDASAWISKAQGSDNPKKAPSVTTAFTTSNYYWSNVEVNSTLGLARLYLSFWHYHRASQKGKWVRPGIRYYSTTDKKYKWVTWSSYWSSVITGKDHSEGGTVNSIKNNNTILDYKDEKGRYFTKPYSNIVFPNKVYPHNCAINITPNCSTCSSNNTGAGSIYVTSNLTVDKWIHYYGSILYPTVIRTDATYEIFEDKDEGDSD